MFTTWSWRPGQTDGQTEGHRSDAPRHGAGVGTDIQTDGRTDGHWTDAPHHGAGVQDRQTGRRMDTSHRMHYGGLDRRVDRRTDTGRMQYAVELASRTPEESTNSAEAGAATAPPPPATLVEEPSSADTSARSRKQ